MRRTRFAITAALASVAATAATAAPAAAQQPAAAAASMVGQMAPAFSGRGATRHGRIADPVRLSDYHGKTLVLAFFFRARTSG